MPGTLYAFNARNGRQMWKHAYGGWGHCTPPDVFVVGDEVWTHVNAETEFGSVWGQGYKAKDSSIVDYRIQALDLDTGKLHKELATKDIFNVGHHHRCYRNKITERFLMSSRRGVEFVDLATGENYQNHWVRSGCLLGYLPCNGLLYVTPHPCGCYINAKINGFNALAPRRRTENKIATRLVKGPGYRKSGERRGEAGDWSTFRHDSRRSGATETAVGSELEVAWKANIGTRPSALVVAGGKVLVGGVDTHTVHALDAGDGKQVWKYTTGGRVDSPPTYENGLAICGSADGRVYCIRAGDGELAWRFEAAPQRGLMSAFGQLESAWPVPGSVMMHEGKCWFAAGRCSYLDDGIYLYALDPVTGNVDREEVIYHPDPETGKMTPETEGHTMVGLLNDIPTTDGKNVFIRQMNVLSGEDRAGKHLFATGGFLDLSWFNRTYWQIGKAKTSGLMVLGDGVAYGVEVYASRSRETVFKPGGNAYRLRCLPLTVQPRPKANQNVKRAARNESKPIWEEHIDIRVTAMVRAADKIFVAGSPDVVDPEDPHGAWEGRKGGVLAVFSATDGERIKEYKLPAPPVWDGMAAARGRLYISTVDGGVLCMRGPGRREVGG
jgi:outer membrane protein assembly factor BamB